MRYVLIISARAVHVSIQYPPAVYIVPAAPAVVVVSAPILMDAAILIVDSGCKFHSEWGYLATEPLQLRLSPIQ